MPSLNHTHTYVKYKSRPGYYRCDDPDCSHFAEKELVIGKNTHCTHCGAIFILDRESAKRVLPRCLECSDTKEARQMRAARQIIKALPAFMDSGEANE